MDERMRQILIDAAARPDALADSISYLTDKLRAFMKPDESVIICFDTSSADSLGGLLWQVVTQLKGIPIKWQPDNRWKTLLRMAFVSRATVIVGTPLVVLGLTKLARATGTPLYIRNVLLAGYPCMDWMIDAIRRELDCDIWGSFGLDTSAVVAGFSCDCSRGVHLRQDVYSACVMDEQGNTLPEGEAGEIFLKDLRHPCSGYRMGEHARICRESCACGSSAPRLMDLSFCNDTDPQLLELFARLHAWTSILDCRLQMGPAGLEIELVTFRGEKLPKLPSCAKMVVRPWNPEVDEPFTFGSPWKNSSYSGENH